MKRLIFLLYSVTVSTLSIAQEKISETTEWTGPSWECQIAGDGTLREISFSNNTEISFFTAGKNCGPSFYISGEARDTVLVWNKAGERRYHAKTDGLNCQMSYTGWQGLPAIEITISNEGTESFRPHKAGIKLGVDTYMESYPSWMNKYFPTLMMCEKTHFYGYMQSPSGNIFAIVSPNPVASWSVDYNPGYCEVPGYWFWGHRIESLNLDLMNELPLPQRNPQNLWELKPSESRSWVIAFVPIDSIDKLAEELASASSAPMINAVKTSFNPNEEAVFEVYAHEPEIKITNGAGQEIPAKVKRTGEDRYRIKAKLQKRGLYGIQVTDSSDKVATGCLTVHPTWEWCLERAREAALKYRQRATTHVESWYGFHSAFIAARHFPDRRIDDKVCERFNLVYNQVFDPATGEAYRWKWRIQNNASTVGMLVDKYEAFGDIADLETASRMTDWIINCTQKENGAYMSGRTVYTSVIYVAKSILELAVVERELGKSDAVWAERGERHYQSAKRAIDQLVESQGDFETEGQLTFEDGMISCSALQIGLLALLQENDADRKHYTDAMMNILNSHDCLAQLYIPDARRRGGTLRFWEAQYDIHLLKNLFSSPHGWSAWRAYATYYAYLLTGEERWIRETFDAMGAFANLINTETGELRWAFAVDPYIRGRIVSEPDSSSSADGVNIGNPHPDMYTTKEFVGGEEYINMVSDWQTMNSQDNDVHEVFKCMGETVLTNAFVIEQEDGTITGYNCTVTRCPGKIKVTPDEEQITNLHVNLRKPHKVEFNGKTTKQEAGLRFIK